MAVRPIRTDDAERIVRVPRAAIAREHLLPVLLAAAAPVGARPRALHQRRLRRPHGLRGAHRRRARGGGPLRPAPGAQRRRGGVLHRRRPPRPGHGHRPARVPGRCGPRGWHLGVHGLGAAAEPQDARCLHPGRVHGHEPVRGRGDRGGASTSSPLPRPSRPSRPGPARPRPGRWSGCCGPRRSRWSGRRATPWHHRPPGVPPARQPRVPGPGVPREPEADYVASVRAWRSVLDVPASSTWPSSASRRRGPAGGRGVRGQAGAGRWWCCRRASPTPTRRRGRRGRAGHLRPPSRHAPPRTQRPRGSSTPTPRCDARHVRAGGAAARAGGAGGAIGGDRRRHHRLGPPGGVGISLVRRRGQQGRRVQQRPAPLLAGRPGHRRGHVLPGVVRQPVEVHPHRPSTVATQARGGGEGRRRAGRPLGGARGVAAGRHRGGIAGADRGRAGRQPHADAPTAGVLGVTSRFPAGRGWRCSPTRGGRPGWRSTH
jgi:hypothetical protein